MSFMKITLFNLLLLSAGLSCSKPVSHPDLIKQLHLPPGFTLSTFADNVPNARSLALGDNGVVFVGTGRSDKVYAVQDVDADGVADKRHIIATGLYLPNGVAYQDGALYVAEVNRIIRFDQIEQHLTDPPVPVVVYDKFPSDMHHGWKLASN